MPEESQPKSDQPREPSPPPAEPFSVEEQVRAVLEQARQDVKRIAKQEREGERINRELLNFRMRQGNAP